MLRQALVSLSISLLIPILHALIFRSDELYSLLIYGYSTPRALSASITLFGSITLVLITPCNSNFFKLKNYVLAFVSFVAMLYVLKRDLDTNLLLKYSNLSIQNHDLSNKIILVTGANSGVGYGISKTFSNLGATVVMGCRSMKKCAKASESITGIGKTIPMTLDLASFQSIDDFSALFLQQFQSIDIAFFNAGFAGAPSSGKRVTTEGYELGLGTMHFGHFVLYKRLEEILLNTKDTRIVMTSSAASQIPYLARFDESLFNDPPGDIHGEIVTVNSQYPRSKLANVLFARHLQTLYPTKITTCSCHIGAVDTSIWSGSKGGVLKSIIDSYTKLSMRSIEEGTRTLLKCALSNDASIVNQGVYLDGMGIVVNEDRMHPPSKNDTLAKRLWAVSENVFLKRQKHVNNIKWLLNGNRT